MTPRCSNCRHWGGLPEGDPTWWFHLFGECGRIQHSRAVQTNALRAAALPLATYRTGDPNVKEMIRKIESNAMRDALAYVADASEYDATLWTKPDFFCACFEERESSRDS